MRFFLLLLGLLSLSLRPSHAQDGFLDPSFPPRQSGDTGM